MVPLSVSTATLALWRASQFLITTPPGDGPRRSREEHRQVLAEKDFSATFDKPTTEGLALRTEDWEEALVVTSFPQSPAG